MEKFEQISGLVDGELTEIELANLLGEFKAEDQEQVDSFFLIGDLLRSTDLCSHHNRSLLDKIEQSIEDEPTVLSPALKNQMDAKRQSRLQQMPARWLAGTAAVGLLALGLNQFNPPLDTEVQMVSQQTTQRISPEEMAVWQEYFAAHQQNVLRGGLSGVSPMARIEADQPNMNSVERVNLTESEAGDWMNVWSQPEPAYNNQVQYQYVSTRR